ncbi:hypothetical protein [Thermomonas sp.]
MEREIEESICSIQAQLFAQNVMLRALVHTHPDPVELLAAWRAALTEAVTTNPAAPAHVRNSEYLADLVQTHTEDWTAELVELAVPAPGSLPA